MINGYIRPSKKVFFMFLTPGFILYTVAVILPVLMAIFYSSFEWTGGPKKTFVGFENYIALFSDDVFWKAFLNNVYLTVFCIIGQIGFAFIFAMILNARYTKFKNFHRIMAYFPVTLSAVVIGFIWSMLYDYNFGLFNYFLNLIGREDIVQPWLSNADIVMNLVSIPIVWQYIGYYLIIMLSGLSSMDQSVFEMAEIDGVSALKKAWYITLPMMKNIIIVCVILCVAGNMKSFDHIFVMTGGGPDNASNLMALHAYQISFGQYKLGYGSAVSIGILVLSLSIVLLTRLIARKRNSEE